MLLEIIQRLIEIEKKLEILATKKCPECKEISPKHNYEYCLECRGCVSFT